MQENVHIKVAAALGQQACSFKFKTLFIKTFNSFLSEVLVPLSLHVLLQMQEIRKLLIAKKLVKFVQLFISLTIQNG